MERYKDYLIDAKALGKDGHWEPRFAIYNADGRPTEVLRYSRLLTHAKTESEALEMAVAAGKSRINEEM